MRAVAGVAGLMLVLACEPAWARCAETLEVRGAQVTFRTRMFQGKPTRRDAEIDVDLENTSTAAVGRIALGIFLGARLEAVEATPSETLPAGEPLTLPGGGLAFRTGVDARVPAGSRRRVKVHREALPLDRDLLGVTARVVGCRSVTGAAPALAVPRDVVRDPPAWLVVLAGTLVGAVLLALLGRGR